MLRRALLSRATALIAIPAALAATPILTAATAEAAKSDYRQRRSRHRTGLLIKDVEGEADFLEPGRRRKDGKFAGDILVRRFNYRRKLTVDGIIDGDASRRKEEIEIDNQSFSAPADLDGGGRWDDLTLDIGKVRLRGLDLVVDPDAVDLDRIYGPRARDLKKLLEKLAKALDDERRKDYDDIDELIEDINKLLAKFLFVVDAGRHHGWR
jgi:hypothetical protein